MDESPYVVICSFNPAALEKAKELCESITYNEILERKVMLDREKMIDKMDDSIDERQLHVIDKIAEYSREEVEVPDHAEHGCRFYDLDYTPQDFSAYALNESKTGFAPMFGIATPEANFVCIDKDFYPKLWQNTPASTGGG